MSGMNEYAVTLVWYLVWLYGGKRLAWPLFLAALQRLQRRNQPDQTEDP